ncbi:MAG: TIGR04283 family arsenosugar biosynthesis glycosyltransferase [Candidatus Hydrothermarchaeales archaeon]
MISIIMPVLNEGEIIEEKLKDLTRQKGDFELIVVDGGSKDQTKEKAKRYADVIVSKKGRAYQMNAGAKAANGDILLFLHTDSALQDDALKKIENAMKNREVVGGGFKFALDDPFLFYRLVAFLANLRARTFKIYPGDHGLFVRRSVFEKIGGFNNIELMEDIDLSKRLKKEGKLVHLDTKIVSSARRLKQKGIIKTFLHMQLNRFLFFIGISPKVLNRFYKDIR